MTVGHVMGTMGAMTAAGEPLPPFVPGTDVAEDKAAFRALVRSARRERVTDWGPSGRATASAALAQAGLERVHRRATELGRSGIAGMTVTAFEPMRTEPPVDGLTAALLDAGVRVLTPVTLPRPRLEWVELAARDDPDTARPMRASSAEESADWLGRGVLAQVDVAFIPGLAISHGGVRLGQGGGYYDTVIPYLRQVCSAPVVVILHDQEVVPRVPAESHDVVVDEVLTPGRGIRLLPLP